MNKGEVREAIKAWRLSLNPQDVEAWGREIQAHLSSWAQFWEGKTLLAYLAMPGEVPTRPLILEALKRGMRVAVPVALPGNPHWDHLAKGDRTLLLVEIRDLDHLQASRFGVPEPIQGEVIPYDQVDRVLVPGLAFDQRGYRVGYGAGYYDRLLAQTRGQLLVGLAFRGQVFPSLPHEPHDIPVHYLLTPEGMESV